MNKKLLTPLFIAASFAMIACSANEIVARPSWVDDPIVEDNVKDKTLKEIYDAIKKLGDTNANVLNKVMYDIAQKQLGHFKDYEDKDGKHIGLKTIANGKATDEEIDDFIKDYPIYKSDEKTYVLNGEFKAEEKAITEAADKRANSISKIKAMYERIYENVFEKLFDEIKGGSYSTKLDKFFEEDYFVQHLYKEMYYEDYDPTVDPDKLAKDRVFIPKTANQKWSEYVNIIDGSTKDGKGFLHLDEDGNANFTKYYSEYISRKVLPEIYRTLLIENYVREQRETNLGRSYARKVNMITVPRNSSTPRVNSAIRDMLYDFATNKIAVTVGTPETNFEPIKDAMVGIAPFKSETESMLSGFDKLMVNDKPFIWGIRTTEDGHDAGDPEKDTLVDTYVYRGTKLYDIVEKYLKIMDVTCDATITTYKNFHFTPKSHLTSDEQAAYDDLTNKSAYTVEKGLEIKEREIRLTDMTTDGWFLKSGGLSELNEKFRDQLFNITTSNILDKQMEKDTPDTNDTIRYFGSKNRDENTGRFESRKAYVFDPRSEANVSVVLDDGSTNFYIVEVEEAASASKLSSEATSGSYLELKATKTFGESNVDTNEIYSKITEQVANSDTYKKNAEQYYLMISNIVFYDQSVYDYFKSQFPDLFK